MTRVRFIISQVIWFILAIGITIGLSAGDFDPPVGSILSTLAVVVVTSFIMQWGAIGNRKNQRQSYNPNFGTLIRAGATGFFWLTYLAAVGFSISEIGGLGLILAFILFLPLVVITLATWGVMGGSSDNDAKIAKLYAQASTHNAAPEKRKRDTLDAVLRDLSDEDLERLRDRLQAGHIDDDVLYNRIVGDDGELVNYN